MLCTIWHVQQKIKLVIIKLLKTIALKLIDFKVDCKNNIFEYRKFKTVNLQLRYTSTVLLALPSLNLFLAPVVQRRLHNAIKRTKSLSIG